MEKFFCSGCGRTFEGEGLEVEVPCRIENCAHEDPEKCGRSVLYAHRREDCLDAAEAAAPRAKRK